MHLWAGRRWWTAPVALGLGLLGGCSGQAQEDRAVAALNEVLAANRANIAPGAGGAIPAGPGSAAEPAVMLPPDRPRFGPAPAEARELLGRRPAELEARLGPPTLRRQEGTAQVWLYLAANCALDLVLYPVGGEATVAYAAARAAGLATEPVTQAQCLTALTTRRRR